MQMKDMDDVGNSIAKPVIANDSISQMFCEPKERNNVVEYHFGGYVFWTIFQVVGLMCVAIIICRSIIFQNGFFDASSNSYFTSITKKLCSNWHYLLSTLGFIYLYANSIFMTKSHNSNVTLPYMMLHTFAYLVSALGLYAMYVHKETGKPKGSAFYQGHLYSLHSWTGVFAAALFTVQWLSAAATFTMPCLHSVGLPLQGKMFSLYITLVSTICLIDGVNQHAVKKLGNDYRTYSLESIMLNGFGMLVTVFLCFITYVVIKPGTETGPKRTGTGYRTIAL